MKKYKVWVPISGTYVTTVEADDQEEAEKFAAEEAESTCQGPVDYEADFETEIVE